jgi:predicted nucleotide-binding protein
MHNYKLDDKVKHPSDLAAFTVVGIRKDTIEIEGDFSGGTHNVTQKDWVDINEVTFY